MSVPADRFPIDGSPGFYTRGGRVEFRFRDKRGRRRWRGAATLKEAKRLRAALETDVSRGEYRDVSRVTFEVYGRKWVESYAGRTSRPIGEHTRDDYRKRLEEAFEYFAGMRLAEIEPQDIKTYAAHLAARARKGKRYAKDKRPLSPDSIRLALAPVKAMLATAFEEGAIRVNPAAGVRIAVPRTAKPDPEEGEVKALTAGELRQVLDAIEKRSPEWLLFFRVLVALGLRFSEICELRWGDVDLGKRTVKITRGWHKGRVGRPKSKYGVRQLRLTPELARELWRLGGTTANSELVFTGGRGARVGASNLMARVLKPAAADVGLGAWHGVGKDKVAESWVGFHTFRHTCATLLFTEAKWNAKQVQGWLGHHSASFTIDTYIHLLPGDLPEPPSLDGEGFGTRSGTSEAPNPPNSAVQAAGGEPG